MPGRISRANRFFFAVLIGGIAVFVPIVSGPGYAATNGQWQLTGSMTSFHGSTALATLPDGTVLAISGADGLGDLTPISERYDPTTGAWTGTGPVNDPRMAFSTPVTLSDGRVLIAGGHDRQVNDYASTELYDPGTGQWTRTGSLNTSRRYAVTMGLLDGRVLVATGSHGPPDGSRFLSSAELYDPATGQWTVTGSAATRRESATGIRLLDGRVIVVGGYTCCDYFTPATDVYVPATGTWAQAGDRPHGGVGMALVVLPDGRVLMAGGGNPGAGLGATTDTLLFDPATGQWSATAPMRHARSGADAVLLSSGQVLVAGGGPLPSEIYDPATGTWSDDGSLAVPHSGAHLAVLSNGSVLIAGGYTDSGATTTSEVYTPAVAVPADTVVVLLAGLWPIPQPVPVDAYFQARFAFGDLLGGLGCTDVTTSGDITKQCNTTTKARVFWSPYSYQGPNGQAAPKPYSGADTFRGLGVSAGMLDAQIAQIRIKHPGARVVLVGHSTGGTVATRWAGEHGRTDIPIVTLDSPVYGFWPDDPATLAAEDKDHYCGLSLPWNRIATPTEQTIPFSVLCQSWDDLNGYRSVVSYDWRGERTFGPSAGFGGASALQLFSATSRSDIVAPPWWNVSPLADGNQVIQCTDILGNHGCVLREVSVQTSVRLIVEATARAATHGQAPTLAATLAAWGPSTSDEVLGGFSTTIHAPANARIIAVGEWGPVPGGDGVRHGDGPDAGTLTCADRPSSPATAVSVVSSDWRAHSYVVFWRLNSTPNAVGRSQVRVLPYAESHQFDATVQLSNPGLLTLTNPCPPGGSS